MIVQHDRTRHKCHQNHHDNHLEHDLEVRDNSKPEEQVWVALEILKLVASRDIEKHSKFLLQNKPEIRA